MHCPQRAALSSWSTTPAQGSTVGEVRRGKHNFPVACESIDVAAAKQIALLLAPVVDVGAAIEDETDLPRTVSYLSITGTELATDPAMISRAVDREQSVSARKGTPPRRRGRPATLRALVGSTGSDDFYLDLREQGPHALVGGTTGSGKSEFLQSWVLGMATAHSPDRVTFLLVDYKGGAAFADCVALPHTVGLVTDLSPHLVRRALTSLRAELRRREMLLNVKHAKDLASLEQSGDPDTPPSLVIVVDEFAALAAEVPEFVDGVIDVAARGRSLGLHLILATQRPAGVIKDNLRANTNLRIALRVNDIDDSLDVVEDPMAAHFPPELPGRAVAKTGPGRLTTFQAAYVGGWSGTVPDHAADRHLRIRIRAAPPLAYRNRTTADPQPAWVATDINRIVANVAGRRQIACHLRAAQTVASTAGRKSIRSNRLSPMPVTASWCLAAATTRPIKASRSAHSIPTATATWPSSAPVDPASPPRYARWRFQRRWHPAMGPFTSTDSISHRAAFACSTPSLMSRRSSTATMTNASAECCDG